MSIFIITGKPGAGKGLQAVRMMRDAGLNGCRIATNMDLFVEHLWSADRHVDVTRLPDWPSARDLVALGKGDLGVKFDEKRFGVLVLDEAATFLNSRGWNGEAGADPAERKEQSAERTRVINWMRMVRHYRWHLVLLTQAFEDLDAQVRNALGEHIVECRRADNWSVPGVSLLLKALGLKRVKLPQVHFAVVRVNKSSNSPVVDRWVIWDATEFHPCYDTEQDLAVGGGQGWSVLDSRRAPYLWEPRGWYELLWKSFLWRWFPESKARAAYNDARFFAHPRFLYKPKQRVTFEAWALARAAHAGALGAVGGEAPEPEQLRDAAD